MMFSETPFPRIRAYRNFSKIPPNGLFPGLPSTYGLARRIKSEDNATGDDARGLNWSPRR